MSVLIGGGTGFIGRSLSHYLKNKGHNVIIVSRSPKNKNDISWEQLKADGLPENTKHVVNLSGRKIAEISPLFLIKKNYEKYKQDLFNSRIIPTQTIVNAIKSSKIPPKSFINASAIGFYKPSLDKSYTEDSPYEEFNFITKLCKEWEDAAKIPDMPQVRQIQLRIGQVLGSGGGIIKEIYPAFIGVVGKGDQWVSWIHILDVLQMVEWIILNESIAVHGPVNATAPNPIRNEDFVKLLGSATNKPSVLSLNEKTMQFLFQDRATLMLDGQQVIPKLALDNGFKFNFEQFEDATKSIKW